MNNHNGTLHRGWQSLQRWRIQIFVITWLAYAAFYFTRKAFSVAKLGIAEDPPSSSTRAPWPISMPSTWPPTPWASSCGGVRRPLRHPRGGARRFAHLGAGGAGDGYLRHPADLRRLHGGQGLAQSTGWSGLCKNIGAFFATYERGRVLGLWSTCYAFGGLVATPFAGWCAYRLTHDWRMAFLSSVGVVLAVAVLFFFLQRNRPQDVGLPPVEAEAAPPPTRPGRAIPAPC